MKPNNNKKNLTTQQQELNNTIKEAKHVKQKKTKLEL
jgi:hypothetical protein